MVAHLPVDESELLHIAISGFPRAAGQDELQHTSAFQPLLQRCLLISLWPNKQVTDSRHGEMPTLVTWWTPCAELRGEREHGMLENCE